MRKSINKAEMKRLYLFGGDEDWDATEWVASDDRVRGGKSESHLSCDNGIARFHGSLDIKTLGGAGFASQRTKADDLGLDLSEYVGIQLYIAKGDKKRYTFILKDDLLPPDATLGREQATISWECDFEVPPEDEPDDSCNQSIFIPWDAFTPTYRGKPKDAEPLDLKNIKRLSIMIRSFFGAQEGDFSLSIESISALCETPSPTMQRPGFSKNADIRYLEDGMAMIKQERNYTSLLEKLDPRLLGYRGVFYIFIGFATFCLLCFRGRSQTSSS